MLLSHTPMGYLKEGWSEKLFSYIGYIIWVRLGEDWTLVEGAICMDILLSNVLDLWEGWSDKVDKEIEEKGVWIERILVSCETVLFVSSHPRSVPFIVSMHMHMKKVESHRSLYVNTRSCKDFANVIPLNSILNFWCWCDSEKQITRQSINACQDSTTLASPQYHHHQIQRRSSRQSRSTQIRPFFLPSFRNDSFTYLHSFLHVSPFSRPSAFFSLKNS